MRRLVFLLGYGVLASASVAQTPQGGWTIDVIGGPVSPANPEVTVRLSAWFDPVFYAFADGDLDMVGDPTGEFRDPVLKWLQDPPLRPFPGAMPGTPSGGSVAGILVWQVNHPASPSPANPIAVWEATWTTSDFTARSVPLETAGITRFAVYETPGWVPATNLYPHAFAPGSAQITVVPAPAAGVLLLAGGLVVFRRHRNTPAHPDRA